MVLFPCLRSCQIKCFLFDLGIDSSMSAAYHPSAREVMYAYRETGTCVHAAGFNTTCVVSQNRCRGSLCRLGTVDARSRGRGSLSVMRSSTSHPAYHGRTLRTPALLFSGADRWFCGGDRRDWYSSRRTRSIDHHEL